MRIVKASISACKKIENFWRKFLWKGNFDNICINEKLKKGIISVKWTTVLSPKDKGGLGITPIANTNFALLTKWLWRYHCEPKTVWRSFINAKYPISILGDIYDKGKYSSTNAPWRSICKGIDWFNSKMKWRVKMTDQLHFGTGYGPIIFP